MLEMLKSDADIPSASTIRRRVVTHCDETIAKIYERIPKYARVHISCDAWTSPNHLAFLGIIIHYIDARWILRQNLIGFEQLISNHTGTVLYFAFQNDLNVAKSEIQVNTLVGYWRRFYKPIVLKIALCVSLPIMHETIIPW